jgi:hypothetical protein
MAQPKGYAAFILFPTPKDDTSLRAEKSEHSKVESALLRRALFKSRPQLSLWSVEARARRDRLTGRAACAVLRKAAKLLAMYEQILYRIDPNYETRR